ncbi:MAG TPA: methyltransferase domain-containing protein [Acidimicrobiales bacterium]|nr:methyltransferase domain-containing protein [Acidimicrobiales bacterium]
MSHFGQYLLGNEQPHAGERVESLGALFNPSTFRHMDDIGLAPGWRVWEVGAGGPGVPQWLRQRVGDTGRVLATDIDTTLLERDLTRRYEIAQHDVGVDEPPAADFDLVHARLVLVHVTRRVEALQTMVRALRPGGWLLVEEADPQLQELACPDRHGDDEQLANKIKHAFRELMRERGVDLAFGRTLARRLREAGCSSVVSDAYFPMGGPACSELERLTTLQIGDQLIRSGLITDDEIRQHLENLAADRIDVATSPMVSAWGRTWSTTD